MSERATPGGVYTLYPYTCGADCQGWHAYSFCRRKKSVIDQTLPWAVFLNPVMVQVPVGN